MSEEEFGYYFDVFIPQLLADKDNQWKKTADIVVMVNTTGIIIIPTHFQFHFNLDNS